MVAEPDNDRTTATVVTKAVNPMELNTCNRACLASVRAPASMLQRLGAIDVVHVVGGSVG